MGNIDRERFIDPREPGDLHSGIVIDLPTPEVRSSAFADLIGEDIERIMDIQADPFLDLTSPAVNDLLGKFGVSQESPAAKLYALFYIGFVSFSARIKVAYQQKAVKEDLSENPLRVLHNLETELQGGTPPVSILSIYEKDELKTLRLSHPEMIRVRNEVEKGYTEKKLLQRLAETDLIDIENSAIPRLPDEELYQIVEARGQLMKNTTNLVQVDANTVAQRVMQRFELPFDTDLSTLPSGQRAQLLDAIREGTFINLEIPEYVRDLFSKLGLNLTHPLEIRYALGYMMAVAMIKEFQVTQKMSQVEKEIKTTEVRESLAKEEAGLGALTEVINRERIREIRALVEEAFQRNPLALGQVEELPVQGLQKEEFEEIYQQVKEALVRMRSEANARPLNPRLKTNRLVERIAQNARVALQKLEIGSLPQRELSLFTENTGEVLDTMRAPELLNLYRKITRNQSVPATLQSFVKTISQENISPHLLRQAGASRQDIQKFVEWFDIVSPEGNTDAQYMVNSVFRTLLEVLDILQTAGQDYSDRKTVEAYKKEMKGTRGELIGSGLFGAFLSYLHPDTIQAFIERSGFNSWLSSTRGQGT